MQTNLFTPPRGCVCFTSSGMPITFVLFLLLYVCLFGLVESCDRNQEWCRWHSSCLPLHYLQPFLFHLAVKWRNVFKVSSSFTGKQTISPCTDVSQCVCVCVLERLAYASWVTTIVSLQKLLLAEWFLAWSHSFTAQVKEKRRRKQKETKKKKVK